MIAVFLFVSGGMLAQDLPVIKPWKVIVQDKDYNGAWLVAGDLTGDGIPELVYARTDNDVEHSVTSVLVCTTDGKELWKWGSPEGQRENLGSDVACQIYDWNNDGKNEVIICIQEDDKDWVVELNGATGEEKRRFEIPENATDCITFCNVSGEPFSYPTDIIVKTRYGQVWAYDFDGNELWSIYRPGKFSTAHQARPFDLDQNGIDEIMVGYVMVDEKGNPMWIANRDATSSAGHLDCARLFHQGSGYIVLKIKHPSPTLSKIVLTYCSGRGVSMIDGVGNLIWGISGRHFQTIEIGKVRSDLFGNQIMVDVGHEELDDNELWVLDEDGNKLAVIFDYIGTHNLINWFGGDLQSIFISDDPAFYDGYGNKLAIMDTPVPKGEDIDIDKIEKLAFTGDMTGDGIPDIVLYTNPGSIMYIYKNENGSKPGNKVKTGTGVNYTLY